jgi:tetratricopeptide (TPR) repeat protein
MFTPLISRWHGSISVLLVITLAVSIPESVSSGTKEDRKKQESPRLTVAGRDPLAYGDALGMLALPAREDIDSATAGTLIKAVRTAIEHDGGWSPAVWNALEKFRSRRVPPSQVLVLCAAGQEIVIRPGAQRPLAVAAAKDSLKEGNARYVAGDLDDAIALYRGAMGRQATCWDAMNNLALTEMHKDNDLVALIVLSILTRNNPGYSGAFVNLVVCLERLGQDGAAYRLAADLASKFRRSPMIQYNLAWFENLRGRYDAAQMRIGNALSEVESYPTALWLNAINRMESGGDLAPEEFSSIPESRRSGKIRQVHTRLVDAGGARAFCGDSVVGRIPGGSRLMVSEESDDRVWFYWPIKDVKHRLWVARSSCDDSQSVQGKVPALSALVTGKWEDKTKGITFSVEKQYGVPHVISAVNSRGNESAIVRSTWSNNSLSWETWVPESSRRRTYVVQEAFAKSIQCKWSDNTGESGSIVLYRVE